MWSADRPDFVVRFERVHGARSSVTTNKKEKEIKKMKATRQDFDQLYNVIRDNIIETKVDDCGIQRYAVDLDGLLNGLLPMLIASNPRFSITRMVNGLIPGNRLVNMALNKFMRS